MSVITAETIRDERASMYADGGLPRYSSYRESGVPWIGRVPSHWTVDRLKWTIDACQNGIWGDEPDGINDIPCVRVADFDRTALRVVDDVQTLRAVTLAERRGRLLSRGDMLLEKSGGGELQPVGVVIGYDRDQTAVCSNFVARIGVARDFAQRFLIYLHAHLYSGRVNTRSINQTTGIQNLDSTAYFDELACWPPRDEQAVIADWLDDRTKRIDELVAAKKRLIELLAEQRLARITHVVCKGLNPAAPMKPSGIEWLGDIPVHWSVKRLAMAAREITNGFVGPTRDILYDEGVRYLQSLHIKNGRIVFHKPYFVAPEWSQARPRTVLRKGDVLLVQTGDVGSCAVVTDEFVGCNCHALIITRLKPQVAIGAYLAIFWQTRVGRSMLDRCMTGALHPHLEVGKVRDEWMPIPPLTEQSQIVEHVTDIETQIDALIAATESAISRLTEYRQSLITAAVTGKIDVRKGVSR
ncbi:MAG: restriction endonuclease subunit S [Phycisphaerales bacterium]